MGSTRWFTWWRGAALAAALGLAAGVPLIGATVASGQTLPTVTVVKVVSGVVPAGTTFTVDVTCLGSGETSTPAGATTTTTGASASDTSATTTPVQAAVAPTAVITFNAQGDPTSANTLSPTTIPSTCTATETVTGGATSVSYSCAVGAGSVGTTCSSTPGTVDFADSASGASATITVTNVFPAPAVVVAPQFTG